jgi:hypothetical protein
MRSPEFLPGTIHYPPVTDPGKFLEIVAKHPLFGDRKSPQGRQRIQREIHLLNIVRINSKTTAPGLSHIQDDIQAGLSRDRIILEAIKVSADFASRS